MILRKYLCNPKLLLKTVLQQKYIMFIHLLILFLSTTLPAILRYSADDLYNKSRDITEYLTKPSPFLVVIIPAAAFVTAFIAYSHLYKKRAAVFTAAIPEKRSCVYLTKLFASCISAIIPYIVICLINIAFMYGYGYFFSGTEFAASFGMVILQYVLVAAIASFAASISGNGFAQIVSMAFFFAVIPVSHLVFNAAVDCYFVTWNVSYDINIFRHFPWISVIETSAWNTGFIVFCIAEALIVTAVGTLAYVKRAVENTGNFFAYKAINVALKYYISAVTGILGAIIFASINDKALMPSYISCIIFAALAFCIIQGVFEKSFKAMFSNIKGFILIIVIAALIITIPAADPLKLDESIPRLTSIGITPLDSYYYSCSFGRLDPYITLESPDILAMAEPMIENGLKTQLDMEKTGNYEKYTDYAHAGFKINSLPGNRRVVIPKDDFIKFTKTVYDSPEYKDRFAGFIESACGDMSLIIEKSSVNMYNENISGENTKLIINSLIQEIKNTKFEDAADSIVYCRLNFCDYSTFTYSDFDIPVYSCYEDTIKLIKDLVYIPQNQNFDVLSIMKYNNKYGQYEETELSVKDDALKTIVLENTGEISNPLNNETTDYFPVFGDGYHLGVIAEDKIPKELIE